jgi:DNA-binding MarR family transcriptional regulator
MFQKAKGRDLDLIIETLVYLQAEGRRLARLECERVGVSPTQLNVIMLLDQIEALTCSELGRRLATQNSTVTGIVDRMVDAGLVKREQSQEDRRIWHIRLTERGSQIARQVDVAPWAILRRAINAMEPSEQKQLFKLLRGLAGEVAVQIEKANGSKREKA